MGKKRKKFHILEEARVIFLMMEAILSGLCPNSLSFGTQKTHDLSIDTKSAIASRLLYYYEKCTIASRLY